MPSTTELIKAPIQKELDIFQEKFKTSLKSKVSLLDIIMGYVVKRKGKQMRPIMVLLSTKMLGEVNDITYTGASLVELLHTATLVHDDVVDDSMYRRGYFSINALWKNKIAVLVGDYLLSKGLLLALKNNQFQMLKELSIAVEAMSEGELLQIEKARKLDITEEVYYDIIEKKTASLLAAACAVGALSVSDDDQTIEKFRQLGSNIGMAFQIRDDLFDYGTDDIGKPLGNDLKEKKMTLPLIYALSKSSFLEKNSIIRIIKKNNQDTAKVKQVIDFVKSKGGLEYAESIMVNYQKKALEILDTLPHTAAKDSMKLLIEYTAKRKK